MGSIWLDAVRRLHYLAAMLATDATSTLTDRFQTTVPEPVRRALRLGKRDKLQYRINANGEVLLSRAPNPDDPALGGFLQLLAQDMAQHPERLQALDAGLAQHLQGLVGAVALDLDAPLPAEGE
jgi:antitoxin PrlF